MTILNFLKIYLVAVPIFFLIDMLWLGVLAKGIYQKYMGHLLKENTNWSVAVLFYLIFIVGIIIFAIHPALQNNSWQTALSYGMLFGFFTYMTFDLTSLSVMKDWHWQIAIIDIFWGMILSGSVSIITYIFCKKFLNL
jgi:uncharacterized membrane protein